MCTLRRVLHQTHKQLAPYLIAPPLILPLKLRRRPPLETRPYCPPDTHPGLSPGPVSVTGVAVLTTQYWVQEGEESSVGDRNLQQRVAHSRKVTKRRNEHTLLIRLAFGPPPLPVVLLKSHCVIDFSGVN